MREMEINPTTMKLELDIMDLPNDVWWLSVMEKRNYASCLRMGIQDRHPPGQSEADEEF